MDKSIRLQVGVKVFLENGSGKYLLLKRSHLHYPNIRNFWDIPGGRIVPGTSIMENIEREVLEETGLSVLEEPKLIEVQDIIHLPVKHIVRLTFLSRTLGEPVLNEEHTEFEWLTPDEMKEVKGLDEFTREVLNKHFMDIVQKSTTR